MAHRSNLALPAQHFERARPYIVRLLPGEAPHEAVARWERSNGRRGRVIIG